ncbi:MAG TPA: T9SS type A sorting domain-containing protein [Candidatus Krumholzibacteria bacterium]|nr:T9SS type A sorting domain-containing protein [Candidatus Krumholzibacteria bacterium]
MKLRFAPPLVILSALLIPVRARALWTPNGVPLCTAVAAQQWPAITTDGAAGAIVAWHDRRNGTDNNIYVQRVDALGAVKWAPDGVPLCTAADEQLYPTIVSDGAGGAIVTWWDYRSHTEYDIYAQRINAAGVVQWAPDGVALCTAANDQLYPVPATDGVGGAIVAWQDLRGADTDIYAQRIDAAGAVQWTPDGVKICVEPFIQYVPAILSDGVGGAFITWEDFRNDTDYNIYGQHINSLGAPLWTKNGVSICGAAYDQAALSMVADGGSGFIVAWEDLRSNTDWDVYAQRMDSAGNRQWTANGVAICTAADSQVDPTMVSDGAGGAILTWDDLRNTTTGRDIYAQRINATGAVQWTTDGVPVCQVRGVQIYPVITTDGAGGAILSWWDDRNAISYDIFVQRLNSLGSAQWTPSGVNLCSAVDSQQGAKIVSDNVGGAIVTWHDLRNGNWDIYAQRIGPDGMIPTSVRDTPTLDRVSLSANSPNPFSGETSMVLDLSADAAVEVDVYDVAGRLVRRVQRISESAGPNYLSFDGRDDAGHLLPSGVYFYSVRAQGETHTRKLVISR